MLPDYMLAIVAAAVGLAVGSFLAVVVIRLPQRRPIVIGRSACPYCGGQLRWFDLIPILSWIVLKGSCRACAAPISPFYPLMEMASAIVAVTAILFLPWPGAAAACLLGWAILTAAALIARQPGRRR